MRIVIHGTGRMGSTIRKVALDRGHEIAATFDSKNPATSAALKGSDAIIDFSHASAIPSLIECACEARVNLVIGTTGWNDRLEEIRARCTRVAIGVVWAPNFSPGANILFSITRQASELASKFGHFESGIEERHHIGKKDAPSGTALRLADEVAAGGLTRPPIAASRIGSEVGLHRLFFDSEDDLIELTHRARNRDGFARGAVIAAELLRGRTGFFAFEELLVL